jgi:uncharacterized membrane protein
MCAIRSKRKVRFELPELDGMPPVRLLEAGEPDIRKAQLTSREKAFECLGQSISEHLHGRGGDMLTATSFKGSGQIVLRGEGTLLLIVLLDHGQHLIVEVAGFDQALHEGVPLGLIRIEAEFKRLHAVQFTAKRLKCQVAEVPPNSRSKQGTGIHPRLRKDGAFCPDYCKMGKQYSNHLLTTPLRAESQPAIESTRANPKKPVQPKEHTSTIIGWILRIGVILSTTIILVGVLLLLLQPGGLTAQSMDLGAFPHTLEQVWSGLLMLRPQAVIASGLLLLIAIPVVTVITSAVAFAVERDRRFVVITLIVLAILLLSLLIGQRGG